MSLSISLGISLRNRAATTQFVSPESTVPKISSLQFNQNGNLWQVSTDHIALGAWHWVRQSPQEPNAVPDGNGGWTGNVLEQGSMPATQSLDTIGLPSSTVAEAHKFLLYQRYQQVDSNVIDVSPSVEIEAFQLSDVLSAGTDRGGRLGVTTQVAGGTLYWVTSTSANVPSQEQVVFGSNADGSEAIDAGLTPVPIAGSQPAIEAEGLTNGAMYYFHAFHRNLGGYDSDVVSISFVANAPTTTLSRLGASFLAVSNRGYLSDYDSVTHGAGEYSAPAGNNRLLVLDIGALAHSPIPSALLPTLSGVPFTPVIEAFRGAVASVSGLYVMKESDIPNGPGVLRISTGELIRACSAVITCYEGVDQITPTGVPFSDLGFANPTGISRVIAATSFMHSSWTDSGTGTSKLPCVSANGANLIQDENGTTVSFASALSVTSDMPGFAGSRRHNYTAVGAGGGQVVAVEIREN